MKIKDYSFTTEAKGDQGDTIRLRDGTGKIHVFSISHSRLVRLSQDLSAFAFEATNRLDYLEEEGREN